MAPITASIAARVTVPIATPTAGASPATERARVAIAHVRRTDRHRAFVVCGGLAVVVFLLCCLEVTLGEYPIPLADVVPGIFGFGDPITDLIVRTVRLPRALCGLLAGTAFGISGAIFQSLARNPLASPDIIGVDTGASAAAVFAIVALGATSTVVSFAAFVGALATAVAVYLLAYRRGLSPFRLVLVGIGVGEMLASVLAYLLTRADIWDAQQATRWLVGSLDSRGYEHVVPVAIGMAALVPATLLLARALRALQLGDDTATGIGMRVEQARGALLVAGTGLAAVAIVAAGPVLFVAFVAPPIARRLTRSSLAIVAAGLVGAVLVLAADLVGRQAFGDIDLPVGIVTAALGAPYLMWLLARANRVGGMG